jgi:hypothetical protein
MSSSRRHCRASTNTGITSFPLRSTLGLSQSLGGLLRSTPCGLISSRNHVQDSIPFRGFSLRAVALPHRKAVAPMPLCHPLLSIRRWFHFRSPSTSRRLPARRSVLQVRQLTSPSVAPLFGFAHPPGSPLWLSTTVTRLHPLMRLTDSAFGYPIASLVSLQRLPSLNFQPLRLRRDRTCSTFGAF